MRKLTAIIVVLILLLTSAALAEGWTCPTCGNDAVGNFCNLCGSSNPSNEWTCPQCKTEAKGNFCHNCGSPRPKGSGMVESISPQITAAPTDSPDCITAHTIVKNYVGRSLSLCGYTSLGGERRDEYGSMTLKLIMLSPDGAYIDPSDDEALDSYKVIAQYPEANTEFTITKDLDGNNENIGYGEIILVVSKNGENVDVPELKYVRPSPNKTLQFVRDYRGRNLADAGYTSLGGKQLDKYGPNCYIQLVITDDEGKRLDPSDNDDFIYYIVKDQDVEPDTEVTCYYSKDTSGKEILSGQTVDIIQITVAKSEIGQATIDALQAETEELRASGALQDLYQGTYEIGKDLTQGNYKFTQITDSCNLYIYTSKEALDNDDGEWCYLYGKGDMETWYLTDGMYVRVDGGATKAIRTDFTTDGSEFLLFSGTYRIGDEIAPGSYEMTLYTDSCSIYIFQNEAAYQDNQGDWDYLYGKGDSEYYVLKEGMVIVVSGGAASVTKKQVSKAALFKSEEAALLLSYPKSPVKERT